MPQRPAFSRRTVLMAVFVLFGAWVGTWSALLPSIQERSHSGTGTLAIVLALGGAVTVPTPLLSAPLLSRLGRQALPWSLAAYAASAVGTVLSTSPLELVLAVCASNVSGACIDIVVNSEVIEEERRGGVHLMQAVHAVWPLSFIGGGLLTGVLRMRGVDQVVIGVVVATPLLLLALVARGRLAGRQRRSAITLLARPSVLALGGLGILAYSVEAGIQSWGAIHLTDTFAAGPLLAALAPASLGAAQTAGRILAQRRAPGTSPPSLMLLGIAPAIAGVLLAALAPNAGQALLGIALIGLGIAPWAPAIFSLSGSLAARISRPDALPAVTTVTYSGFMTGPALVGAVAAVAGLRAGILSLGACAVLLGAGLAVRRRLVDEGPARLGAEVHPPLP